MQFQTILKLRAVADPRFSALPLSSIIFTSVCVYLHLFVCLHYVQYKYLTLKIYIISSYLDSSFVALARRLSATIFNCMGEQFLNFFILRVVL